MNYRTEGTVYLIHFERPYKHAQHYLGWTPGPLMQRIEAHRQGKGAGLMKAVVDAGIAFQVVMVWPGGHDLERRLHESNHTSRWCPICHPEIKDTWEYDFSVVKPKRQKRR